MLIIGYRLRPSVAAALRTGMQEAERTVEVAHTFKETKTLDNLTWETGVAGFLVADLRGLAISKVAASLQGILETSPFLTVTVVPEPQGALADQLQLFALGRAGVADMPMPEDADRAEHWYKKIVAYTNFDIVTRCRRELREFVQEQSSSELLLRIADHATVPSVKALVNRLYPDDSLSPAYKRRLLWKQCRAEQLANPEDILAAVRLYLLKALLDTNQWTVGRIAKYFGMDTARHLNRGCKNRYELSCTEIRKLPSAAIQQRAAALLRSNNMEPA